MSDELDLNELARLIQETHIDESWFTPYEERDNKLGTFHIGDGMEDILTEDYVSADDAEKLLTLFRALPRLIELARVGQAADEIALKNFGEKRGRINLDDRE